MEQCERSISNILDIDEIDRIRSIDGLFLYHPNSGSIEFVFTGIGFKRVPFEGLETVMVGKNEPGMVGFTMFHSRRGSICSITDLLTFSSVNSSRFPSTVATGIPAFSIMSSIGMTLS